MARPADNPSAVYYNPAGITQLQGHNVRAGVYTVAVKSTFDPDAPGRSLETRDEFIPLPGMYYTYTPETLPLFDREGQRVDPRTVQTCIDQGWAEPWFRNPLKPDWLVCKLTDKGRRILVEH